MMNRKIIVSVAALGLATGLAACSNDGDTSTTVEETATETNVSTETVAEETETVSSDASESAESGAAAADGAEATEELALASGETALVPQGVIDAIDKHGEASWGEPIAAEETDGGWIISYDGEHYVTWNEATGGAPIWGEIANVWINDVDGARELGFPTMPETPNTDETGWNQEFENGTIEWKREAGSTDAFEALVTKK
ncbi:LGFP repeat protein [Corynebacterium glaucum]|uniref:LGFP repeat protein n=1 Tax=Corynebacterium glaucum TaxID=187491 RepID=A0A1Q2HVH0_9CORY|nr:hypothetical protein [Corynebacterium glaucum]AQQ14849.1 LGFP repeat protein [Corynebacterium glaucum]